MNNVPRQPSVFLTSGAEIEAAILEVVQKFTLNREQTRAFRIVTNHSLGQSKVGTQLLMEIFGEGGTGKSRIIEAIHEFDKPSTKAHYYSDDRGCSSENQWVNFAQRCWDSSKIRRQRAANQSGNSHRQAAAEIEGTGLYHCR